MELTRPTEEINEVLRESVSEFESVFSHTKHIELHLAPRENSGVTEFITFVVQFDEKSIFGTCDEPFIPNTFIYEDSSTICRAVAQKILQLMDDEVEKPESYELFDLCYRVHYYPYDEDKPVLEMYKRIDELKENIHE